jgi:hypothetical protein
LSNTTFNCVKVPFFGFWSILVDYLTHSFKIKGSYTSGDNGIEKNLTFKTFFFNCSELGRGWKEPFGPFCWSPGTNVIKLFTTIFYEST